MYILNRKYQKNYLLQIYCFRKSRNTARNELISTRTCGQEVTNAIVVIKYKRETKARFHVMILLFYFSKYEFSLEIISINIS